MTASGERVIVMGGTGGLGIGVCSVLRDAGYRVTATWVVEREVEPAQAALGPDVELRRLDVGSPEECAALAGELAGEGGPWGVVQLVGGFHAGDPVAGMDLDAWDTQFALNLRATAVVMRAFLPGMTERGGGRVVAVSSRAALRPFAGASAYTASKAGVITLVEVASDEVKDRGVTVNCILPSVIDTPGNRRAQPDADHSRWVKPEEIGEVIRFLVSHQSTAVTGAAIPVYGRA